jgi:hypothetical protein
LLPEESSASCEMICPKSDFHTKYQTTIDLTVLPKRQKKKLLRNKNNSISGT